MGFPKDKKPKKTYTLNNFAKKELRKQQLSSNENALKEGLKNASFSYHPVDTTTFEPPLTQNVTQTQPTQQTETTEQPQNYLLQYGNSGLPNSEVSTLLGSVLTGQTQQNLYDNVSHSLGKMKEGAESLNLDNAGLNYNNALAGLKFMNGLAGLSFLPITAVNEVMKQNPVTDWLNKGAMLPFELADELYTLTQKGTDYAFEKITGHKPDRSDPLSQELDEFLRTSTQLLLGGKAFHETGKFFKKGMPEVKEVKTTATDEFANKLNEQPETIPETPIATEKKPYEQPATIIGEQPKQTPEIDLGNKRQTFTKIINEFDKDLQTIEQKLASGEITKAEFDELEKQYNETENKKKTWQKRLDEIQEEPKPIETVTENKRKSNDPYSEENIKNPQYPDRTNEVIERPKTEGVTEPTEVLSEKEFNKKYKAQHKDVRSKTEEEKLGVKEKIVDEGFNQSMNVNALPIFKKPDNAVSEKYGNKKGDIIYLLPKDAIEDKPNGYQVKKGHKPLPSDIIRIEYDNQPTYEAYKKQILNKLKTEEVTKPTEILSEKPKIIKVSSLKTDEGKFSNYDIEQDVKGRANMFTVLEDNNGWIVRNALIPNNLQQQGIATEFYKRMNDESIKNTGKPLRSTQSRELITGGKVHEVSQEGIKLWDSLVRKGLAEKISDKNYKFKEVIPETKQIETPTISLPKADLKVEDSAKLPEPKQDAVEKVEGGSKLKKVGDKITYKGEEGEIIKVYPQDELDKKQGYQSYRIRTESGERDIDAKMLEQKTPISKNIKINTPLLNLKNTREKSYYEGVSYHNGEPVVEVAYIFNDGGKLRQDTKYIPYDKFEEKYHPLKNENEFKKVNRALRDAGKFETVKLGGLTEAEKLKREQDKNILIEKTIGRKLIEPESKLKEVKISNEQQIQELKEKIRKEYSPLGLSGRRNKGIQSESSKKRIRNLENELNKLVDKKVTTEESPTLTQKKQARKKQLAEKKNGKGISEQQKKANNALENIYDFRERVNGLKKSDTSGRANRSKNIVGLKKAVSEFNAYSPESFAKIRRSSTGNYIITIDGKPLRREAIRQEFNVKAEADKVDNPEANKSFKELGAEERETQRNIANDLDSLGTKMLKEKFKFDTPAKVLKKGLQDIKDDSGKETSPEAIVTRDEMLEQSKAYKDEYKSKAENNLNKTDESDIPEDADTSFNFGENAKKKPTIKTDDSDTKIKISQLEKRKKDLQDKLASGELDKEGSYKTTEKTKTSEQPDFFGKTETQSKLDLSTERDINEVRKSEARKEIKIIDDEINKLKQSEYNSAKQTIKDALSKDSGISFGGLSKLGDIADPKVLKAVYDVAKYHTGKFAEWSKKVIADVGNWIKPHLRNLYNEVTKDRTGLDNVVTQGLNLKPIKQEVKESFSGAVDKIKRGADTIRKIIAPVTRGENAKLTAKIITEKNAELVRQEAIISEGFKEARKQFDKRSNADNLKMIDAIETGSEINNPLEKSFADEVRKLLDAEYKKVTDRKGVKSFIENYFPHIWEQDSQNQLQAMLSRRPLEGSKSFLKKRTIPTTREGIEAGLKPVTYNPVDLALLKLHEMKKFNMAHEIMDNLKAEGLVKYIPTDYFAPAGWTKLNDKIGTIFGDPGITATEYVDKHLYNALQKLATDLGIKHSRVAELRGTRMGEASPAGYINTKYATPEDVLAHEIGHHLQFKYNLWDYLTGDIHVEGRNKTDTLKKTRQERVKIHKELRALADLRAKGEKVSDSHKRYLREKDEKMAVVLQAYTHIPAEMREVAPTIFSKFEKFIDSKPQLQQIKQIKPSLVPKGMDMKYDKNGILIKGHYYLPEPATRIINNHLSPGLKGEPIFDIYRGISNTLNQVQLGASLFHASFTSGDANLSKLALGLMKISRGKKEGLLDIATSPIAFITNPVEGNKIRKDYLSDRPNNPELVNAITRAGGRISMDRFYTNDLYNTVKKAFKDGKYISGSLKSPFAMFEVLSKPVLEYLVPRQKLGVFSGLAKDILQDEAKGKLTKDQATERLQEAWRSVDNRMGQLVYDNLYWDHVVKDIAMASVRSVGWNLGTFRELGGGIRDIPKIITEKRLTPRTAYALALPIGIGLLGAVYSYLNGTPAESIKDLYFPRTGHKNKDGVDDRISLPSYMKDVFAYGTDIKSALNTRDLGTGAKTLSHKMHPAISMLLDLINNHDYFGNEISDNTPFSPEWFVDEAKYIAKQFRPFTVNNISEMNKQGESLSKQLQSFFGFQLAPGYIRRSDMQNRIYDTYQKRNGEKIISKPEAETRELKRELKDLYLKDKNAYDEKIADLLEEGKISSRELNSIESDKPTDIKLFKYLPADDKIELWNQMNKEEKQRYQDGLTNKIRKTLNLPYKIPSNAPKGIIEKATPEQYTEYENEAEKRIMQFEKDNKGMDKDELQKQRNKIRKDIRKEMNLETEKEKKETHLYIPGQQNYFNQPKTFKNHLTIPK